MVSESGAFEPALIVRLEVLVALLTTREETKVMEEVADVPKVRPGQVSPAPTEVSSPAQYDSRHISPSRSSRRIEQIVAQEALQRASGRKGSDGNNSKQRVALSVVEPFVIQPLNTGENVREEERSEPGLGCVTLLLPAPSPCLMPTTQKTFYVTRFVHRSGGTPVRTKEGETSIPYYERSSRSLQQLVPRHRRHRVRARICRRGPYEYSLFSVLMWPTFIATTSTMNLDLLSKCAFSFDALLLVFYGEKLLE